MLSRGGRRRSRFNALCSAVRFNFLCRSGYELFSRMLGAFAQFFYERTRRNRVPGLIALRFAALGPPPHRAKTGLVGDPGLRRKEGDLFFPLPSTCPFSAPKRSSHYGQHGRGLSAWCREFQGWATRKLQRKKVSVHVQDRGEILKFQNMRFLRTQPIGNLLKRGL